MATVNELDLAPPEDLSRPLWKSLIRNFRDRFLPDQLPPLYLTSRPVNLGMLLGDFLDLPWYRTVFTNLGDVILQRPNRHSSSNHGLSMWAS